MSSKRLNFDLDELSVLPSILHCPQLKEEENNVSNTIKENIIKYITEKKEEKEEKEESSIGRRRGRRKESIRKGRKGKRKGRKRKN